MILKDFKNQKLSIKINYLLHEKIFFLLLFIFMADEGFFYSQKHFYFFNYPCFFLFATSETIKNKVRLIYELIFFFIKYKFLFELLFWIFFMKIVKNLHKLIY